MCSSCLLGWWPEKHLLHILLGGLLNARRRNPEEGCEGGGGGFRDHSRPETKRDVGPFRLCLSDHPRFLILLPSGPQARIFLNFAFISGR